jgi:hypothetical protein
MRFLIRTRIPAEPGNRMIQETNFLKKLEEYVNRVKPGSSSYFVPLDDQGSMALIINAERSDQLPAMVEPLFHWMGANVDVIPLMNFDDLKMGLENR